MKSTYREKRIISGKRDEFLEVDIFSIFPHTDNAHTMPRKKRKPTQEMQKQLNAKNCARRLERLINCNFDKQDIKFELTYRNEPENEKKAQQELRNFFKRVKRYYKSHNLFEVKYIAVIERGERGGRIHHHCIMTGGIDDNTLNELWGNGAINAFGHLREMDGDKGKGYISIAKYFCGFKKHGFVDKIVYRRYNASRNLTQPKALCSRDYEYRAKQAKQIHENNYDYNLFSEKYPNYEFVEKQTIFNEEFGGYYIYLRLRKIIN